MILSNKDFFYDLMFKTATIQKSPESLYQACI